MLHPKPPLSYTEDLAIEPDQLHHLVQNAAAPALNPELVRSWAVASNARTYMRSITHSTLQHTRT
jgi:hypothetical protein